MIMISRDRVNVPRDMTIWAARRLREALEVTAALAGRRGIKIVLFFFLVKKIRPHPLFDD